jgi:predicted DNA-binding transcriptional regulator YafY
VQYSKNKNSYQKSSIEKHLNFLENSVQNSMTLFKQTKTATIKATPNVAKYFKKGMKKFLSSQEFQKELEDKSVIFTLKYTQEIEIMPFIQKWLPDLIVLEPKELKEHYVKKLQKAIENYSV